MKQKAKQEPGEEDATEKLNKKQKKKRKNSNEQLYNKEQNDSLEEDGAEKLNKKQKKKRKNSSEQLDNKEQNDSFEEDAAEKLNKKQKKKGKNSNEQLDNKEQNDSLDYSELKVRKKHKGKKKNKNIKEITAFNESKEKAVNYLNKWKYDHQNWKFEKVRQVWLLKHMLKDGKVPDSVFSILVEYLNGAKGHARQAVLKKTMEVVNVMEKCAELSVQGMSEEEIAKQCPNSVSEKMYERARTILQCLQDSD